MTRMGRECSQKGSAFKILTCESTGKRILGKNRRRWDDNIIMGLKEIVLNTRIWIDLAKDRNCWGVLVDMGFNWVP